MKSKIQPAFFGLLTALPPIMVAAAGTNSMAAWISTIPEIRPPTRPFKCDMADEPTSVSWMGTPKPQISKRCSNWSHSDHAHHMAAATNSRARISIISPPPTSALNFPERSLAKVLRQKIPPSFKTQCAGNSLLLSGQPLQDTGKLDDFQESLCFCMRIDDSACKSILETLFFQRSPEINRSPPFHGGRMP